MRINKHFSIEEFVTPRHVEVFGKSARWHISDWQIETANLIRDVFDNRPMTINSWQWGGGLKNRGTRLPNSPIGSFYSQHKLAMAIDFNIEGYSSEECYKALLSISHTLINKGITTIESLDFTPEWIHLDGRYTGMDDLFIVKPRITTKGIDGIDSKFYYDL